MAILTAGTVGGTSVAGYVVGEFSIQHRSPLRPTTASRTLNVSAGGAAGIDWANVQSPTTTLALTNTTISASTITSGTIASIATGIWQDATAGDFTVASSIGKALYINNVAPGGAGGHFIAGSNTGPVTVSNGVTFTNASGSGFTVQSSGGNGDGFTITGNGTGHGINATSGGGSGAHGLLATAAGTNGHGFKGLGSTTGDGMSLTGGATGRGLHAIGGATSGEGIRGEGTAGNSPGIAGVGQGSGAALDVQTGALVGVVNALTVTTYAEPGQGTPAATNTLLNKINYLFKAWLNQSTQTSASYQLYNSAGTVVDQKAAVSDDSVTFTRQGVVSGP